MLLSVIQNLSQNFQHNDLVLISLCTLAQILNRQPGDIQISETLLFHLLYGKNHDQDHYLQCSYIISQIYLWVAHWCGGYMLPYHRPRVTGSMTLKLSLSFCLYGVPYLVQVGFLQIFQCPPASQKHTRMC